MRNVMACFVVLVAIHIMIARADAPAPMPLVNADYQRCVTLQNGPLRRPRGPVLYPNHSEIS